MSLLYGHQLFFLRSMCEEKNKKTVNPEVDKQSKCFGEILKGRLKLNE